MRILLITFIGIMLVTIGAKADEKVLVYDGGLKITAYTDTVLLKQQDNALKKTYLLLRVSMDVPVGCPTLQKFVPHARTL